MANRKIRILICNRYVLFRTGIKALLRKQPLFEIVGEAGTVRCTVKQVQRLKPDIVLMGEAEADWSIAEVTRCIKTMNPDVKVLVVNLTDDQRLLSGCLDAGASGFLRKDDDASQLQSAISAACGKNGHGHLKAFVA
jgi:two-component system, NarL family, nitrate/nitrite response regulator NarL